MDRWKPMIPLGLAQFLVVLDTSVMNVSISQLVEDFHTTVTAIQAVITIYTLVMAAFLVTGGKVGDLVGRRRAFAAGLVIYGIGSLLTAVAPSLWMLILGWSVIEGLGGALVLPALAALVGGNYVGRDRATAYGVIGGLAGAGIAVGPLLGGWVTTYLTWRLVFAGEVVVVVIILALMRWIKDTSAARPSTGLDVVGAALSVTGLALVVLGVLQSSTWGWLRPVEGAPTILGFSATPFVIAGGLVVLGWLRGWVRHRQEQQRDPIVRWSLFGIPPLRAGLSCLLAQNLILLGVFFTVPLYLQVVQGLNAFQTGLRLLPVSVTMLVTAMSAPFLNKILTSRAAVRAGFAILVVATLWLVGGINPRLDDLTFGLAMAILGVGMGLLAAQLGNVAQSSVGELDRGEVGGLQYTAQNLGSSLGTAFIGSVLISALAYSAQQAVAEDPRLTDSISHAVGVAIEGGLAFVPVQQVEAGLMSRQVPPDQITALVDTYVNAQLLALKTALLAAAGIALVCLFLTRNLPHQPLDSQDHHPRGRRRRRDPMAPGRAPSVP